MLAVLSMGCGDEPQMLRIVDLVDGRYALTDVPRGGLDSLDTMSGRDATIRVDATIRLSSQFANDGGVDRDQLVSGDEPGNARTRSDGDVAVAIDLDSLGLMTSYALIERAIEQFASATVLFPSEPAVVYYAPQFDAPNLNLPESDNAVYLTDVDAFALFPTKLLDGIPLAMNPGVFVHEVSHRMFYYRAFDALLLATLEAFSTRPDVVPTFNRIRALDEGLADFFAASFTGEPSFLSVSVPPNIGFQRDLTVDRDFPTNWLGGIDPTIDGVYDPYAVGVLLGSTLWFMAEEFGHEQVRAAVLNGLDALRPTLTERFEYRFGDFLALAIQSLDASRQARACEIAAERFSAAYPQVASACT